LSDGEAALAPSLLRYDGVALELAKLRDELDGAQNGEGSAFERGRISKEFAAMSEQMARTDARFAVRRHGCW
jgi:hypothetical protein